MSINPKKIVCVFAHPDDEAFGPAGTIAMYAKSIPVHIVCVTSGDALEEYAKGNDTSSLSQVRKKELEESAKILGVSSVTFLDFKDGGLSNNNYHQVTKKLQQILGDLKPDTLITFSQNGVTGHLDHIAVSMEASYLFEHTSYIKSIMYFCEKREVKEIIGNKYFVYYPHGYLKDEVDVVIDVSEYLELKKRAIKAHVSQKQDAERVFNLFEKYMDKEYFCVLQK